MGGDAESNDLSQENFLEISPRLRFIPRMKKLYLSGIVALAAFAAAGGMLTKWFAGRERLEQRHYDREETELIISKRITASARMLTTTATMTIPLACALRAVARGTAPALPSFVVPTATPFNLSTARKTSGLESSLNPCLKTWDILPGTRSLSRSRAWRRQ